MGTHQVLVSLLVGILCNTLQISEQLDSFLIYNEDHQKCVEIVSPDLVQASDCDPSSDRQRFRWISGSRILSISHEMCLGVNGLEDWGRPGLLPCDELSPKQKWECRSENRFAIMNGSLHLNYGDGGFPNILLDSGSGWVKYGAENDLCSHGYQATGWESDPVTGVFYQRNTESALTWYQARKHCQQQGADLLSITELQEQSSVLTDASGSSLWIGLNSLDFEKGWRWSDGNTFRYLNWAPGHPLPEDDMDCAALNPGKASKWESLDCGSKLGYICRKGNSTTITPSVEKDEPSFCPANWVSYSGHCYSLSRTKMMWNDALAACLTEGANLASIHNTEEHSFMISQSGYLPTDELWIGLHDQKTQNLFEWSDRSDVTFAKWLVGEPSHTPILREHCVVMKGKEGKWADETCEKVYGYMCKKEASTGCPAGWIRFSSYCYSNAVEAKTFNEAETACGQSAANLVQVADRYENTFLISQFGLRPEKYFWIGLSNTERVETFEWTNKQTVDFTHFNAGMPERHQGCVAMLTGTSAGLWDVISCDSKEKYICKKLAEGVAPTKEPPVTHPLSCPSEWMQKDPGNCVRLYLNSDENKKTWTEARNYCKDIGGDLASFHAESEINKLPHFHKPRTVWIGYNKLDSNARFVWSDGTASNYKNWKIGEPDNAFSREHCVYIDLHDDNAWYDIDCEVYHDWICQIRLGTTPKPPPTNTPQAEVTITDDGWIQFNGSQYYINNEHLDMEDARTACKKKNSDLVVITSPRERTFVYKQISRGSEDDYYIGLTVELDKSVRSVDGSPVFYTIWDYDKPSFYTRDENCVVMKWAGFWNNVRCGRQLPSICKRSAIFVSTTAAPTTVPEGGCRSDWTVFQGKCYKFAGKDSTQDKSWHDARQYCISQGGNLVSILSQAEQEFLTTMMLSAHEDVWIGFSDVTLEMLFLWTDGTGVSFTNWAKGNPVSVPDGRRAYGVDFDCVVMVKGPDLITGMWKVEHCEEKRGFVCKRNLDPLVEVPVTTVAPASYFKLGNNAYKLQAEKMSWDEARRQCKEDDADLASVLDSDTQTFITNWTVTLEEPIWIGLSSNVTDGRYRWIDNWFLTYTKWAVGEPQWDQACVYIDTDGTWKTSDGSKSYYSLCKRSPDPLVEVPVTTVAPASYFKLGNNAYKLQAEKMSWDEARRQCKEDDADLASVLDSDTQTFITNWTVTLKEPIWIGLNSNVTDGQYCWIDNWFLNYTKWAVGEPQWDQACVYIDTDGTWKTSDGSKSYYSLCKRSPDPLVEVPVTTVAPASYFKLGNNAYKLQAEKMSWDEARRQCKEDDADLASVLDSDTQTFITNWTVTLKEPIWIGLSSNVTDGQYRWLDNWFLNYTKWAVGEPQWDQACVYIDTDGTWKTSDGSKSYYSLCKRSPDPLVEVPVTTVAPASYFKLGNNAYKLQAEKMSWDEARRQCKEDDADLASVLDSDTQTFITNWTVTLKEPIWIGLSSNVTDGQYRWIDNWFLTYTKWAVGEPQRDQACVYIDTDGTWKTSDGSKSYYSLCKRSPGGPAEAQVEGGFHGYGGIVAAVVLALIAVAGFSGFLFYKRKKMFTVRWECTFDNNIELTGFYNL